jgi:hypothetical protein
VRVQQLRANRPAALAQLRRLVADGNFEGISVALVLAPFDDMRQAAYFMPWCAAQRARTRARAPLATHAGRARAVVRTDEAAGTALQDAYIGVRAAWKGVDDAAIEAARFAADDTEVTAALDALEAALDAFEARIPAALTGA